MNFNFTQLENLFYDIQEIVDYVESSKFCDRKFTLFFSNGDKINYSLSKENIAHLLGIDTNALASTGIFKSFNSFDILKEFIDNPFKIHNLAHEGVLNYKNIFSEFILEKIKVFKSNISPNIFEMEFVCKYNSKRSYTISDKNAKYDYILVKKIKGTNNYSALCLVNSNNNYVAMSSMYFEDKDIMQEGLKEYVENQEITLFNGVKTVGNYGDYERTYNLNPESIVFKLEELFNYKKYFNAIIDTTSSYLYSLRETLKHMDKHFDDNSLTYDLVNQINEGKLVDRDKYIFSGLINIVDSYNNLLVSYIDKNEVTQSYSKLQILNKELKQKLTELHDELQIVKSERDKSIEENKKLEEENIQYKKNEESIIKILKPGN